MNEFETMKRDFLRGEGSKQAGLSLLPMYNDAQITGMAVRLYQTDVLTVYQNGSVLLRSGGWRTRATLKAINHYLAVGQVYQSKKRWYVSLSGGSIVDFKDGMVINPGSPVVDYTGSTLQPITVEQPAYN